MWYELRFSIALASSRMRGSQVKFQQQSEREDLEKRCQSANLTIKTRLISRGLSASDKKTKIINRSASYSVQSNLKESNSISSIMSMHLTRAFELRVFIDHKQQKEQKGRTELSRTTRLWDVNGGCTSPR